MRQSACCPDKSEPFREASPPVNNPDDAWPGPMSVNIPSV